MSRAKNEPGLEPTLTTAACAYGRSDMAPPFTFAEMMTLSAEASMTAEPFSCESEKKFASITTPCDA